MSEALARLFEAFVPETIDRRGYLYDDPTFGYPTAVNPFTSLTDREDGRYRPYYDTEIDLAYIRGGGPQSGAPDACQHSGNGSPGGVHLRAGVRVHGPLPGWPTG